LGLFFAASGGGRAATLRAGRFWPPGSSPILSVLPGTVCDRLLPERPKSAGAAPIQFRDRLLTHVRFLRNRDVRFRARRSVMILDYTLAGLVTAGLLFYLTYALLKPERF
jgi:K+-transporting ATPase KdpF subunit